MHDKSALPAEISSADISGDEYLKPVLEDDALIFALDSLPEPREQPEAGKDKSAAAVDVPGAPELQKQNEQLQSELESLTKQFENYRLAVQKTLDQRWGVDEDSQKSAKAAKPAGTSNDAKAVSSSENSGEEAPATGSTDYYFESYSHSGRFTSSLSLSGPSYFILYAHELTLMRVS